MDPDPKGSSLQFPDSEPLKAAPAQDNEGQESRVGRGRPCTPLLDLIPGIGTAYSTPSPPFGEHPEPPPPRKGMSQTLVLTYLAVLLVPPQPSCRALVVAPSPHSAHL